MSNEVVQLHKVQDTALGLRTITKSQIAEGAQSIVADMLERGNELDVAVGLSAMEAVIKDVKSNDQYVQAVRALVEQRGEKGKLRLPSGTVIELAEVGVKYDYTRDEEWSALDKQISELSDLKKKREEFLRRIPAGKTILDEETGEVAYGPAKTSTSSYKVTIAK